jgi:hypothetical protein
MRLTRDFTTAESEAVARKTIAAYLEGAGFRSAGAEPSFVYERGSAKGSMFGFSPKKWQATATVDFTSMSHGGTDVCMDLDVNTTGQWVTKRERGVLEAEMDGLVAAVSGKPAATERPSGESARPALRPAAADSEQYRLESQAKSGANWFYWIAGLSLINTAINLFGGTWAFVVGLGAAQFVDAFVAALTDYASQETALVAKIIGLIVNLILAAVFAVFGALAGQRRKWAFIVGMLLYALDGVLCIVVGDWWGALFHLFPLYGLFIGLKARNRLDKPAV